jgi:acyl-CoA thioester hydrolase
LAIAVLNTEIAIAIPIVIIAARRSRGGNPSASSVCLIIIIAIPVNLTEAGFPNKVRRMSSQPIVEHHDIVRPEWIDSNGHMNLAYYVVVFDLATDALYNALDIGNAYRDASGNSCFTAETHTLYEREVHLNDRLSVRTWLLGADRKRLHYFHEMFHADSAERSAVQELMALHIDMNVRRVVPFPRDKYMALRDAVKQYAPAVLPHGAGRRIQLPG